MKTILTFVITAALALAAEPKKPAALTDKQQADAAKALAKMQSAIRSFAEVNAAREGALKAAQEAASAYQRIEADLRKATGAPSSCRLNEEMAWIRDVPNPGGQPTQAPCEIEPEKKPEVKK